MTSKFLSVFLLKVRLLVGSCSILVLFLLEVEFRLPPKMSKPRPLVVFDFDHTLLDVNSDVEIQKLLPGTFIVFSLHDGFGGFIAVNLSSGWVGV